MANELQAQTTTGLTLYAVLLNSSGQVWNTSGTPAFETYNGANWTDYDIALTEAGAGIYLGNMPAVVAGNYSYLAYERAGVSPATTDTLKGTGSISWDGTSEGTVLAAVQGAITWAQQKIVAEISAEGALDIVNSDVSGYGLHTSGLHGQFNDGNLGSGIGVLNQGAADGMKNLGLGAHGIYNVGAVDGLTNEGAVVGLHNVGLTAEYDQGTDEGVIYAGTIPVTPAPAAVVNANMTQISGDEPAADALEAILDGTRAKLYLSQLNIASGGNDSAILTVGSGTGSGLEAEGGVGGPGISAEGHAGGGLYAVADGTGYAGIVGYGAGTNTPGMKLLGLGSGAAFELQPGNTGGVAFKTIAGVIGGKHLATGAVAEIQSGLALEATLTAIKGAGWSDQTLVAIDILLEAIRARTDLIEANVEITIAPEVEGSTITIRRGDTLAAVVTGLGSLVGYTHIDFGVKKSDETDYDVNSLIWIRQSASGTDGLLYLNGSAGTAGDGEITIDDEADGDITIRLAASATKTLAAGNYLYDIQVIKTSTVETLASGTCRVTLDVIRAVS